MRKNLFNKDIKRRAKENETSINIGEKVIEPFEYNHLAVPFHKEIES